MRRKEQYGCYMGIEYVDRAWYKSSCQGREQRVVNPVFTLEIWASIARLYELSFVGTCVLTCCVLETHGSNSVLRPRAYGLAVRNTRT